MAAAARSSGVLGYDPGIMSLVMWKAGHRGKQVRWVRFFSHPPRKGLSCSDCRGCRSAPGRTIATLYPFFGLTNSTVPPPAPGGTRTPPFQGCLPPEAANFRHPLPTPCRPLRASSGTTQRDVLCSHRTPRAAARDAAIFTFSDARPAHAQRRVTVAERGQTRSLKLALKSRCQAGQALNTL